MVSVVTSLLFPFFFQLGPPFFLLMSLLKGFSILFTFTKTSSDFIDFYILFLDSDLYYLFSYSFGGQKSKIALADPKPFPLYAPEENLFPYFFHSYTWIPFILWLMALSTIFKASSVASSIDSLFHLHIVFSSTLKPPSAFLSKGNLWLHLGSTGTSQVHLIISAKSHLPYKVTFNFHGLEFGYLWGHYLNSFHLTKGNI